LLRKHCKERAAVATQFLTHLFYKIFEKSKNSEKQRKSKKKHIFLYICIVFSIFSIVPKEFNFSKVF